MPSNHSANFFAGSLFLITIFKVNRYSLIFLLISCSVAISRIYLGKHFPYQVFAGALYGAIFGVVGGYVYLKNFKNSSLFIDLKVFYQFWNILSKEDSLLPYTGKRFELLIKTRVLYLKKRFLDTLFFLVLLNLAFLIHQQKIEKHKYQ